MEPSIQEMITRAENQMAEWQKIEANAQKQLAQYQKIYVSTIEQLNFHQDSAKWQTFANDVQNKIDQYQEMVKNAQAKIVECQNFLAFAHKGLSQPQGQDVSSQSDGR